MKPYVMSLRSVAKAQSSNMAANEWTNEQRWGVEHNHTVDIESSDVEDAESDEEFIHQLCEETRVERQLLAKDLAKLAPKGAKFIGDAFGQRGLEDQHLLRLFEHVLRSRDGRERHVDRA